MSTDIESLVLDPRGPVHTGSGAQYNATVFADSEWKSLFRKSTPARLMDGKFLAWLTPRFVEPPNYGDARDKLAELGLVLLDGDPGSGRQTAAMMLLHRSSPGRFHKLSDRPEERGPALDPGTIEAQDRLLLDLSDSDEPTYLSIQRELSSFRTSVGEKDARLVVVLPSGPDYLLSPEFAPLVQKIGRPPGSAVVQRYLRTDGAGITPAELDAASIQELLTRSPMRDLAKFADLTRRAPGGDAVSKLRSAASALRDRGAEVDKAIRTLRQGRQRAMLLSAAMLTGAPADDVFEANRKLLAATVHPIGRTPRLEQSGLGEDFASIGVELDPQRRVGFGTLAYDEAVRTHFWDNFLDLRESFRDWVGDTISANFLTREAGMLLVSRFAEQALRTNRPQDLKYLAEKWAKRTDPRRTPPSLLYAAQALEAGLADDHHGLYFREQIYWWSRIPNLPGDFAQVLVEVCAGVMAATHPERALIRLHNLARLRDETAREAAQTALKELVEKQTRLFRRLLERLARYASKGNRLDQDLFLDSVAPEVFLAPQPLIRDDAVRANLVVGWTAVMAEPGEYWREPARAWLTACEDSVHRDLLLDVLVESGSGASHALSRLYVIARDWAADSGAHTPRRPVFVRLSNKIDAAQGIAPEGTA
jgi:hypothetical protein